MGILKEIFGWAIIGYVCIVVITAFISYVSSNFGFFSMIGFIIAFVVSIWFGLTLGKLNSPKLMLLFIFLFSVGYIGANIIGGQIISFVLSTINEPLAMLIGLAALVPIWWTFKTLKDNVK